jgi:hypothetical protein
MLAVDQTPAALDLAAAAESFMQTSVGPAGIAMARLIVYLSTGHSEPYASDGARSGTPPTRGRRRPAGSAWECSSAWCSTCGCGGGMAAGGKLRAAQEWCLHRPTATGFVAATRPCRGSRWG